MKQKMHSSRVLWRFSLSYLILMVIPLLMGIMAYSTSLQNANEQLMKMGEAALERAASEVDCSLLEAKEFANTLMSMNSVAHLMNHQGSNGERILSLQKSVAELPEFKDTYRLFQRYFIYLPESDIVVDNKNAYIQLQDYYATTFRYGDKALNEFRQDILRKNSALTLLPATENVYQQKVYSSLIHSQLILSPERKLGRVIFYLDEDKLLELIRAQCGEEVSFVALYGDNGEVLLSTDHSMDQVVYENLLLQQGAGYFSMDETDSLISVCRSESMKATFVVGIPKAYVTAQLSGIMKTLVFGMLSMLMIGLACAVVLMQSNRKPLIAAIEEISRIQHVEGQSGLWSLTYAVRGLLNSREELAQAVSEQRHELQNAAFRQVIHGGVRNEKEIESLLNYVGINLNGEWFAGAFIRVSDENQLNEGMSPQGDLRRAVIIQALEEMQPNLVFFGMQDQYTYAMVYVGQGERELDENVLSNLYCKLVDCGEANALISVGSKHRHLTTLYRSFKVATQQLEQSEPGAWLLTAKGKNGAQGYYYSSHDDERLVNLVSSGKADEVKGILDTIWHENFVKRNVIGLHREILYYRMLGTLISAGGSGEIALSEEKHSLYRMSPEEFFRVIWDAYQLLCRQNQETKLRSSDKLVQDVIAYLEAHYAEYDTCLSTTALHFGLTEKYFSAFFKEKTGVNFANYLEDIRINQAERMCQEGKLTIEEISQAVGYNSSRTFRRAYYRCKSQSPSQARKLQGE